MTSIEAINKIENLCQRVVQKHGELVYKPILAREISIIKKDLEVLEILKQGAGEFKGIVLCLSEDPKVQEWVKRINQETQMEDDSK